MWKISAAAGQHQPHHVMPKLLVRMAKLQTLQTWLQYASLKRRVRAWELEKTKGLLITGRKNQLNFIVAENGPFGTPFLTPKLLLKKKQAYMWVPFLRSFPGNEALINVGFQMVVRVCPESKFPLPLLTWIEPAFYLNF